jgi:hypothetical protein
MGGGGGRGKAGDVSKELQLGDGAAPSFFFLWTPTHEQNLLLLQVVSCVAVHEDKRCIINNKLSPIINISNNNCTFVRRGTPGQTLHD